MDTGVSDIQHPLLSEQWISKRYYNRYIFLISIVVTTDTIPWVPESNVTFNNSASLAMDLHDICM